MGRALLMTIVKCCSYFVEVGSEVLTFKYYLHISHMVLQMPLSTPAMLFLVYLPLNVVKKLQSRRLLGIFLRNSFI